MNTEKIARARELLKDLELQTKRSVVPFARRTLCAQEFLSETKRQIQLKACC